MFLFPYFQLGIPSSRPTSTSVSGDELFTDDGGESLRDTPLSAGESSSHEPFFALILFSWSFFLNELRWNALQKYAFPKYIISKF